MPEAMSPTEIARETLRVLVSRHLVPTPDNYLKVYAEIARDPDLLIGERVQALLRGMEKLLPSPAGNRLGRRLEAAVKDMDTVEVDRILNQLTGQLRAGQEQDRNWAKLIREFLRQWDQHHRGLSPSRKKEALERVLAGFGSNSNALYEKLENLARIWSEYKEGAPDIDMPEGAAGGEPPADGEVVEALRDAVVQAITLGVVPRISKFADLVDEANGLAEQARRATDILAIRGLAKNLKQFWTKLAIRNDGDAEVLDGLLRLLRLLIDNISEIVMDDIWLQGQMGVIREIIDQPPSPQIIYDTEQSFRELIYKQSSLKHSLEEAKTTLKNMVATFIGRLDEMSRSTGDYESKISHYADELSSTDDIVKINQILGNLLTETKGMQIDIIRSRDELEEARRHAETADTRIRQLEGELSQVSAMVQQDFLTGALNRRGMADAFTQEQARSERTGHPLAVALLDVDHFKRFNDTYGHDAGDAALIHLVTVVKEVLRPTDIVSRFGGEEFVLLLPNTDLDGATIVMERLQRELTKRFFLHDNQRLLITFSAGIALWTSPETEDDVVKRADTALYRAKEAGRNRVFTAT